MSSAIKVDHFGYPTQAQKIAIFTANPGPTVEVRATGDAVAFAIPADGGSITSKGSDAAASGDTVWWVDFSSLTTPGTYRLYSPTLDGQSYDFEIADDIYNAVTRTALKTFYYQRCNTPKSAVYAGAWADDAACHMGDMTTTAAAGNADHGVLDLTGGWHDAGDYNKYVWSAVSNAVLQLLRAFEDNPGVFVDDDLNIPESGNGVPDILDEVKYEVDWLLKMQLPDGSVLSQTHVNGWDSASPPSADTNQRYYQNPNLESGAVFAGTCALTARVFAAHGLSAEADTYSSAALRAWTWLQGQGDSDIKAWAAAQIFRLDPSQTAARAYVDGYHANSWQGVFFNPQTSDTEAALTYVETPGATPAVVTNMMASINAQVDYIFSSDDLYRNGMPSWSYYWGSNAIRACYGVFLVKAARLDATGSHTTLECKRHALDFLHFFHGQNALNMVYLTNMGSLGGEHSSYQMYHSWFGASWSPYSTAHCRGKPPGVVEPDYPYFKGVDNHGVSDDNSSPLGPAPGFVPGGPNTGYSGDAVPPGGAGAYNRYYRDWCEQSVGDVRTWEITESSIGYQGSYVALGAYFMTALAPVPPTLSIQDGETSEGDAGTRTLSLPVDLTATQP